MAGDSAPADSTAGRVDPGLTNPCVVGGITGRVLTSGVRVGSPAMPPRHPGRRHLRELVDRFQAGDTSDIARCGKPVARLTAVARPGKRTDAAVLRFLTATVPPQAKSSAECI
jgi:antitoxin (DNA-binding transcriptional repressor) of toxin-antitoxin stability system